LNTEKAAGPLASLEFGDSQESEKVMSKFDFVVGDVVHVSHANTSKMQAVGVIQELTPGYVLVKSKKKEDRNFQYTCMFSLFLSIL
jgi:ferredoxin-fold anticodon binding domain-containing protein